MNEANIARLLAKYPCTELASGNLRTCPVRLSFPHLFKPHTPKKYPDAKPKYSSTLLFPKGADLSALIEACERKAAEQWPAQWKARRNKILPFLDQGEERFEGYVAGAKFIRSTADQRPEVLLRDAKTPAAETDVFPGVWALVTVHPFVNTYKDTISLGLGNVLVLGGTERLGGGAARASDEFEPLDGDEDVDSMFDDTPELESEFG